MDTYKGVTTEKKKLNEIPAVKIERDTAPRTRSRATSSLLQRTQSSVVVVDTYKGLSADNKVSDGTKDNKNINIDNSNNNDDSNGDFFGSGVDSPWAAAALEPKSKEDKAPKGSLDNFFERSNKALDDSDKEEEDDDLFTLFTWSTDNQSTVAIQKARQRISSSTTDKFQQAVSAVKAINLAQEFGHNFFANNNNNDETGLLQPLNDASGSQKTRESRSRSRSRRRSSSKESACFDDEDDDSENKKHKKKKKKKKSSSRHHRRSQSTRKSRSRSNDSSTLCDGRSREASSCENDLVRSKESRRHSRSSKKEPKKSRKKSVDNGERTPRRSRRSSAKGKKKKRSKSVDDAETLSDDNEDNNERSILQILSTSFDDLSNSFGEIEKKYEKISRRSGRRRSLTKGSEKKKKRSKSVDDADAYEENCMELNILKKLMRVESFESEAQSSRGSLGLETAAAAEESASSRGRQRRVETKGNGGRTLSVALQSERESSRRSRKRRDEKKYRSKSLDY